MIALISNHKPYTDINLKRTWTERHADVCVVDCCEVLLSHRPFEHWPSLRRTQGSGKPLTHFDLSMHVICAILFFGKWDLMIWILLWIVNQDKVYCTEILKLNVFKAKNKIPNIYESGQVTFTNENRSMVTEWIKKTVRGKEGGIFFGPGDRDEITHV